MINVWRRVAGFGHPFGTTRALLVLGVLGGSLPGQSCSSDASSGPSPAGAGGDGGAVSGVCESDCARQVATGCPNTPSSYQADCSRLLRPVAMRGSRLVTR